MARSTDSERIRNSTTKRTICARKISRTERLCEGDQEPRRDQGDQRRPGGRGAHIVGRRAGEHADDFPGVAASAPLIAALMRRWPSSERGAVREKYAITNSPMRRRRPTIRRHRKSRRHPTSRRRSRFPSRRRHRLPGRRSSSACRAGMDRDCRVRGAASA